MAVLNGEFADVYTNWMRIAHRCSSLELYQYYGELTARVADAAGALPLYGSAMAPTCMLEDGPLLKEGGARQSQKK